MKNLLLLTLILLGVLVFFSFSNQKDLEQLQGANTIVTRFVVPAGYERQKYDNQSFAYYLQHLPLKPANALVTYFNGQKKSNNNVYKAVVDLKIGNKDLHQCADAVMRLRAEYLFSQKQYNQIHFNFTNGMRVDYSKWMKGYRIKIKGNQTAWVKTQSEANNLEIFWTYLEQIFQYAGTASLDKELKKIAIEDIKIGDVFIKGGFPGHAVIVVDMAKKGNSTVFALAQSYMPAQELQVLNNPENNTIWYNSDFGTSLTTPEWIFTNNQLKRF